MQEIKCPNCGTVFQVDESEYAQILRQVRDEEFKKELEYRAKDLEEKKKTDVQLVRMEQEKKLGEVITSKASELAEKERIIEQLRMQIAGEKTERELAVSKAVQQIEKELSEKQTEITRLKGEISNTEAQSKLREQSMKTQYEDRLKLKDEQIEYYKDFKARQSTKMVGESLEQHCLNQFNSIRMTAFPNAYFEKDNDARSGSKGDFIFREAGADGTEFISIMFEMKNEMDETATKHKNEDFFKELDKDRRQKNCEYAVLVSLLEIDNEIYNNGIVDES